MRTYAQLTTSFVVFCNRVGVDESISFWGGSEVIAPTGAALLSAPMYDEGLFSVDIAPADIRRERIGLPLLRDERPELQLRELARIIAERAGMAHDSTSEPGAEPGLDLAPGDRSPHPIGFRREAGGMTSPVAFELPPELAIDTDIARRVIGEFIRGQLRQAGFERAVLGLSGGIDSALVAYLTAEAIGADKLLCVLMPYRTSSPASRSDAEEVVRRLGTASELVDITPMVDGFYGPDTDASDLRRGNFMARMRMSVLYDRSVTWGGLVVGTGNKTESLIGYTTIFGDSACAFNPVGDLYKSQVRQLAAAMDVPDSIIAKAPSADLWPGQTDEIEVGVQLSRARSVAVLAHRQAPLDRRGRRARLRAGPRRAGRSDGRRRRVQAPGAADRQARAADGGRRLPVPAPAAGVGTRVIGGDAGEGAPSGDAGRGAVTGDGDARRRATARRRAEACCTSWPRRSGTCRT